MKDYIGKIVEVSDDKETWKERTLLAILPDHMLTPYIVPQSMSGNLISLFKYARPVKEERFYYQYEHLSNSKKRIVISEYMTDKTAKEEGYTKEKGWYKIENSKRIWEH